MEDDVLKAVARKAAKTRIYDREAALLEAFRDMGLGEYVRTAEAAVELVRKTIEDLDNRGPSLAEAEKVLADVRTAKQRVLS